MTASTSAVRPARPSDVAAIESFVERPAARRLYGAFDVGRLVERATVAVVAEEGGAVVAFLAVTARAPMPDTSGADGHHDASARLAWAKRTALELCSPGGTRFECGSTLWLAACATAPALQVSARAVLRRMLRECFARAPLAPRALFFAGPNAVEQTPIGSLIEKRATNTDGMTTDKSSDEKKTKFALYSCARKDVAPAPIARDARLEDYDDLFSLAAHAAAASGRGGPRAFSFGFSFEKEDGSHENENDTSTADSTLRAMSSLIAEARSASETRRVLVAVDDDAADDGASCSKIVALMAVTTEGVLEDARAWSLTHDTAAYDDFAKPEEVDPRDDEGDAEEEREETKEELRGSVPSEADRDASEEATTSSKPFEQPEPSNDTKRTRTNDAFRVVAFASLPGYDVSTAVPLLDAAFARFEEVDFCVAAVPAEAREVPFTTHEMVRVPFRPGMGAFADQVLYARHREADAPGFEIRPGAREDAAEVASLLLGTPRADAQVETFEAAAAAGYSRDEQKSVPEENASASKNASLRAFVATCDGQVVGYLVLDLAAHAFARLARRRFRLDEVVDEPDESAFALLVAYELNPVFAHRRRRVGFMLEALRLAGKACALYAHSLEEAPDENLHSDAFPEEEPRRLPDVAARDFRMARSRRLELTDPENENRDDANHALFVFTSRVAYSPRRVVDAKVLVVGGDDVALAAAETLAAHESLLFESVSLAAPAGGVYPGGFPVSSAYCSCVSSSSGSTTGHASLAKLALGLDRVAYHEADLESVVFDEASGARHARFADGGEQRFDALLLCLASRDETRRAVLGDGCDDDPDVRDTPVERLDDFVQQVSGMPREERNELVETCECVLVYGATLDALGASRTLARLGFEPGSVLRVVPEAMDITHEDEDVEGVETETRPSSERGESGVSERLASFAEWAASSTKGLGLDALSLPGQPPALRGLALAGCEACVLRSGAPGVRAYFSDTRTGAVTAVEATALLGCDERDVDQRLFAALDSFGLVTDGGVVVDGALRTNDARVFAAGDVAKFSRSVFGASKSASKPLSSTGTGGEGDQVATKPSKEKKRRKPFARAMRLRDARECGDALARAVAARFSDDSLFFDESVSSTSSMSPMRYGTETKRTRAFETTNDAPVFARARVEAVTLPSGAFFFRAATPEALAPAAEGAFGGSKFKTRTTRFNGVFCRVETDARNVIVSLSYCGRFVDARRHARCVGLPASLFFDDDDVKLLPERTFTREKESDFCEKEKEDDAFCLWSALCRPAASALFHEDFLEAFNDAKRRARTLQRDLGELKKEDIAAAAQENAIAFVGKRAAELPAYHDVLFGGGV
eukprot:CAMPEP_0203005568 /NCGR_PEP_ID=MMETSP1401-20130829/3027_1 /ASSEMBLY_ACC=CAM_ASM_000894 /TAXON_ID=38833 /ORGANISM="Micromonas pusilla, Strain CCAC1681" /LENGTH=1337 /DNA_ID=CAMNT_0049747199 /DNA_START=38 /DNA_END=4048 /DNA_ORIENTATION=+